MTNFDDYSNENKIKHNSNWPYISDHPYRIKNSCGSGKTNALISQILIKYIYMQKIQMKQSINI